MPVQTRARAKATDKPPSPLKNILKAPARRIAKAKTASATSTADSKVSKKSTAKATKAAPRAVRATDERSQRAALTGSQRGRKVKIEEEVEEPVVAMDVDEMMVDAPTSKPIADLPREISIAQMPNGHQSPTKASKIPMPATTAFPAACVQATPSVKENTQLRHKISSTRLAKTAIVKKSSKEGLMSRSPLKSSLSLQSLLSAKKPVNTTQLSANDTKLFTFSKPASAGVSAPFMEDDVFQDQPIEPIFKYSSMLSPEKTNLGSPRKPPTREKFLSTSPSRKGRSPDKRHSPARTPSSGSPMSPEHLLGSMVPFSSLFPGIPNSPKSSPHHPAAQPANLPRKPLSEMGSPVVPPRSSSKSPKKHEAEPLTSRSPSKVPRLSPSKTSLRGCESIAGVPPFKLSMTQIGPQSPTKSSMRLPAKQKSTPNLSPKKSVTWNDARDKGLDSSLLRDCVFYVDVQTAEGSDAGPLFIPLLKDMGASIVSQWTSNSMNVTHVLFKDGGDRTLEKVVASNGAVKCVNVGWAVDCERFNKRLPEHDYAIDLSRIPGQTPMTTPRAQPSSLTAHSQSVAATPIPQTPVPQTSLNINNTKISITTPAFYAGSKTVGAKSAFNVSFQPSLSQLSSTEEDKENLVPDDVSLSPSTPYFLHPQDLIQKSCPPKPSLRGGADGRQDNAGQELKQRLLLAKRKSMEWAPKISSPLRLSSGGEEC